MTKQEAIKILKNHETEHTLMIDNFIHQALRIAIKELGNEDEDCVSRKAVTDALPRMAFTSSEKYREALLEIENLPSVKSKNKEGEWIPLNKGWNGWKCSECNGISSYTTYCCSKCGSYMKGKDGDNLIHEEDGKAT